MEKSSDAEGREAKPSPACDDACDEYSRSDSYEEEEDVKVDASDRAAADEEECSDESGSDDRGEEVTAREEDEEGDEYDEYSDEHSSQGSADVEGSEEELREDCPGSEYSYEEEEDDVSEGDGPPDAGKAGSLHNKECDGAQEVCSAEGRQNNTGDSEIAIHELENDTAGGSKQDKALDEAADVGEAVGVEGDAGEHVPEAKNEAADDAAGADQSESGALKDDSQIPLHEAEDADPEGDTPGGAKQGKAVDEAADAEEAACVDSDAGENVPEAEDGSADDAAGADQSGSGVWEEDGDVTLRADGSKEDTAVDEAADAGGAACVDGDAETLVSHVGQSPVGSLHNKECAGEEVGSAEGRQNNADDSEIAIHELENDTAGGSKQDKALDEAADVGEAVCVEGDAGEHVPEAKNEAADDAAGADQSESGALKDDSQIPLHEAEDADPEGDTPGGAKQGKAVDEAADAEEAACVDSDAGENVPEAEDGSADDAAEADQSGSGVWEEDGDVTLRADGSKEDKAVDEAADAGGAACVDSDARKDVPETLASHVANPRPQSKPSSHWN